MNADDDSPDRDGVADATIALWVCETAQARAEDLAHARSLLSEDELASAARFHFEADRQRYLLTRALVRTVFEHNTQVPARDWRFAPDAYGRPCVASPVDAASGLTFNVSHTRSLIVMGLARGRALGVDVEDLRRDAPIEVAHRYFSPVEARALARVPMGTRAERFF